jgi:hypothetical protein
MTKRIEVIYLGRLLGTASGWDGEPGQYLQFHDFIHAPDVALPNCHCLILTEDTGVYECQDETGKALIVDHDIVNLLSSIPRLVP